MLKWSWEPLCLLEGKLKNLTLSASVLIKPNFGQVVNQADVKQTILSKNDFLWGWYLKILPSNLEQG